jgi:hypothetical protein
MKKTPGGFIVSMLLVGAVAAVGQQKPAADAITFSFFQDTNPRPEVE